VEYYQPGFVLRVERVFAPGQIDKIIIWQVETLPVGREENFPADKARQHGLQMAIRHAAHGDKGFALFRR
jgi:hypothetical protein